MAKGDFWHLGGHGSDSVRLWISKMSATLTLTLILTISLL